MAQGKNSTAQIAASAFVPLPMPAQTNVASASPMIARIYRSQLPRR